MVKHEQIKYFSLDGISRKNAYWGRERDKYEVMATTTAIAA